MNDTRERILDVALEVLGRDPDAGMGELAAAAGVVRRTVYGYFPSRADLVRTLGQRAADEVAAALDETTARGPSADAAWAAFVIRLWPLTRRYRLLVTLRRGEYGEEIHALLRPVEASLTRLVERGQEAGAFGRHLPADALAGLAWGVLFAIADRCPTERAQDARAATITSLLLLGTSGARATALVDGPL